MAHRFDPGILRDYDIRGVVGTTLDAADAHAVGRGFGTVVRRAGGRRVAVGRDGRTHGPMLEAALVDGLVASGVDVVRIGIAPTPMLYFAEATLEVDGAIQVTGSHNPVDHNGFKLVIGHRPFFGDAIRELGRRAAAGDWDTGRGTVADADIMDAYVDRLVRADRGVRAFRIGWDAGNGAAGPVVEQLVRRLPGEHHLLHCCVDGTFPNHHPDPSVDANLDDLRALVRERRLDFGVAFDGDGDRIGAIDADGRAIPGDRLLAILAGPVLRDRPGATVIADVKASDVLFARVAELGGVAVMAKTGHSHIKQRMAETGALLAGETTGHLFFADDYHGYDDAPYAAVRLIRAVGELGGSLAALDAAMPASVATPELRFPAPPGGSAAVVAAVRARLAAAGASVGHIDGVRVATADGWWLLRASNTEDRLVARAEGRDRAGLDRLVAAIDAQLALSGVSRGGS